MSFEVTNPFPVFTDTDGTPLENGKLFIGVVNLNPETNPVSVFFDAALTIPAAQPIRTIGGYPSRDGTPANLFISDFNISITVRDKKNELVFSNPDANEAIQFVLVDSSTKDNIAAMTVLVKNTLTEGIVLNISGYFSVGDGGGGRFSWTAQEPAASATENGGTIFESDEGGPGRWERILDGSDITDIKFGAVKGGVTNNIVAIQTGVDYTNSIGGGEFVITEVKHKLEARLDMKSNVTLINKRSARVEFDFDGVLGVSSGEFRCVLFSSLTGATIEGINVTADVTSFTNNGFDTFGILGIDNTDCHVTNCRVQDQENGIIWKTGNSRCSITKSEAFNCYAMDLGSLATSSSPNIKMKFHSLLAFSDKTTAADSAIAGFRTEETYDSDIRDIEVFNTFGGVRIENSCDNAINGVVSHNNWAVGMELYNISQRNTVSNIRIFDNNRTNRDAVDEAARGNENTKYSGFNIENTSNNNTITNIITYQTPATTIPFTSGSDEPVLGSLLQGAISGSTGRVRRIELTSGSFAGNDAAGIFHIVEVSGAFSSNEVIKNITTAVPYNSGSERPTVGDTLTGSVSGASGILLWESSQGGTAETWGTNNSTGVLYLTGVTGNFNGSENLNNTTTSENNFATNSAAETPIDLDIATTNGATVIPTNPSKGFQKFGIGINVRNLPLGGGGDGYNVISNHQSFNNDIEEVSDRGVFDSLSNGNKFAPFFTRNTP